MPLALGAHANRVRDVRELLTVKGRREQQRFMFEGATQLDEARRSGVAIESLYVTQSAYDGSHVIAELERDGTAVFIVDDRVAAKISDLVTPTGIVGVGPLRYADLDSLFAQPGLTLVLADLNDPGNAGTLLRSAEAFGATGVAFGRLGVDPYHPKVVRAAMGSLFRLRICVAEPAEFAAAAHARAVGIIGLAAGGEPLQNAQRGERTALIVGHERRGLGTWGELCERIVAISITPAVESLNAAIAGSIALYELESP